jgi:hypothetical protein
MENVNRLRMVTMKMVRTMVMTINDGKRHWACPEVHGPVDDRSIIQKRQNALGTEEPIEKRDVGEPGLLAHGFDGPENRERGIHLVNGDMLVLDLMNGLHELIL